MPPNRSESAAFWPSRSPDGLVRPGFRRESFNIGSFAVSNYLFRNILGDNLRLLQFPAPSVEPGGVLVVADRPRRATVGLWRPHLDCVRRGPRSWSGVVRRTLGEGI